MDLKSLEDLTEDIKQTNEMVVQRTNDLIQSNGACLCECQRSVKESEFANRLENIHNKVEENDVLLGSFKDMELETQNTIDMLKTRNKDIDSKIEELKKKVLSAKSKKMGRGCVASPVEIPTTYTDGTKGDRSRGRELVPLPSNPLPYQGGDRDRGSRLETRTSRDVANVEKQRIIPNLVLSGHFEVDAAQTVLCIDTSESMAENGAWEQTCTFVQDYLAGIEEMSKEHNMREERVALVTFGNFNIVQEHLTFDMHTLRDSFKNLQLGGPSPLYGGLVICDGAICLKSYNVDEIEVYPKVVLITDGKATDTCVTAGPDIPTSPENEQETQSRVLGIAESLCTSDIDVFCVPVGMDRERNEFLNLFVGMSDGIMLNHTDGRTLARRLLLTKEAATEQLCGLSFPGGFLIEGEQTNDNPDSDRSIKENIMSRIRKQNTNQKERFINEAFNETSEPNLPKPGTRVRRGPDGNPDTMLDGGGPGTVTGHSKQRGKLVVYWDRSSRYQKCRYGTDDKYDLIVVDEPRIISSGTRMAVGCIVVPGQDWDPSPDLCPFRGICLEYDRDTESARVRWNDGFSGTFSCTTYDEKVKVLRDGCQPSERRAIGPPPATQKLRRNKNLK